MSLDIKELRETFEVNSDELKDNRNLVNELIVDDLMVGLGFNKKRDKTVKRLYNEPVDWEVLAQNIKMAVKVFSLSDTDINDELKETIKFCLEKRFSILIITNGEGITIMRYNKEEIKYTEVIDISFMEEVDETKEMILSAISKDTFNMAIIDEYLSKSSVSYEQVVSILEEHSDDLKTSVANWLSTDVESISNHCDKVIDALKNPVTNTINENNGSTDVSEYTAKIEELEIELNNAVAELEDTKENLQRELDNTRAELQLEKSKATEITTETVSDDSSAKDEEIAELKTKIDELQNKLDLASSSSNNTSVNVDNNTQEMIDAYVAQIRQLSVDLSESKENEEKYKNQVDELKAEIENLSGADRKHSLELLDIIEDNPELERNYVAVINSELQQYDKLSTFVGRCLQKLYEIKSLEASQYIFNGDLFKLIQPAVRNDMIMGNKAYDIDMTGAKEDEYLNKLRIIFTHFDDVIFECKKVGHLTDSSLEGEAVVKPEIKVAEIDETIDDGGLFDTAAFSDEQPSEIDDNQFSQINAELEQYDASEEQDGLNSDGTGFDAIENAEDFGMESTGFEDNSQFSQGFGSDTQSNWENTNTEIGDSLSGSINVEGDIQSGFEFGPTEGFDDFESLESETSITNEMQHYLLAQNLANIDELVWTQEPVQFNTIKYIGTNDVTYMINVGEGASYDKLLCKCIDALLAIEAGFGNLNAIIALKSKDLSFVNNSIKLYTEEYKNYPRINGTKYAVVDVQSVPQVATILSEICNAIDIPSDDKFLYIDANTDSNMLAAYAYSEDAIQLRESDHFVPTEVDNHAIAVVKGDMFNTVIVTKNSLEAHKCVFLKTMAVKTQYLGVQTDTIDDIQDLIGKILEHADTSGIEINSSAIGQVVGEKYRLVSYNEAEVNPEHKVYMIGGRPVFVSNIEMWQATHSIIRVHTSLFNNDAIALKTEINANAVNYYGNDYETTEPSLSLAIKSFVHYIAKCVK